MPNKMAIGIVVAVGLASLPLAILAGWLVLDDRDMAASAVAAALSLASLLPAVAAAVLLARWSARGRIGHVAGSAGVEAAPGSPRNIAGESAPESAGETARQHRPGTPRPDAANQAPASEFEALFFSSPTPLLVTRDVMARVVIGNGAYDALMKIGTDTDTGDDTRSGEPPGPMRFLLDGVEIGNRDLPLARAALTGQPVASIRLELRAPGHEPRFVMANATPLLDRLGRPRGAVGAMLDISARVAADAQLHAIRAQEREARLQAQSAEAAKDEFLAMLGHEIRNPLNAITNSVQVLQRVEDASAAAVSARNIILRQANKLAQMLDELLDVGQVIAADVRLLRQPLELSALARRTVDGAYSRLEAKHQTLRPNLAEAWLHGDVQRIGQVIDKLLDNAFKHSPVGATVDLDVRTENGDVVLRVANPSPRITPDDMNRLFEPFVQGPHSLDRQGGGFGIGLALVRRVVEMHDGSVRGTTDGGQMTIEVRLPAITRPPQVPPRDVSAPAGAIRRKGKTARIAVIDDNLDALQGLRSMLELDGHSVRTASDGLTGLTMLVASGADVAIVDIGLPGIDGYEVAVRSRAAGYRGRLIALSGYGQKGDLLRSRAAGFEAHLLKPVDPSQLHRVIAAE